MALSAVVLALGLLLEVASPPAGAPATLQGTLSAGFGRPTLSAASLASGLGAGGPISVLEVGIIVLVATPVSRVFASVILFLKERDMLYVGVTGLVLAMLLIALFVVGPVEAG